MVQMNPTLAINEPIECRTQALFHEHQQSVYRRTDRLFGCLLLGQWLAGILIALWVSPRTWAGQFSDVHIHVWTAIVLGALITFWPVFLAFTQPGKVTTRHVIAVGQMLYAALLIHLTGGRIETHFHIFGSLAFLSFYRDWRVLITASIIVVADHLLRGIFFPLSVYGVTTIEPWRWVEHAWWVLFEDIFLIRACLSNVQEMHLTAHRQAEVEQINANIEKTVCLRTDQLSRAKLRLSTQYAVVRILAETGTWNEALTKILKAIATCMLGDCGRTWCAYWSVDSNGTLSCIESLQLPEGTLQRFAEISKETTFAIGTGIPGRVWVSHSSASIADISQDENLPRQVVAIECKLSSAFGLPVIDQDTMLGVIEFFTEKPLELDDDVLEMLQTIGQQIGQFVMRKGTEQERNRLASVVQHATDAIFTESGNGIITSWNRGAEQIFGYTADQAKGQRASMLLPADKEEDLLTLNSQVSSGERIDDYETQRLTKGGELIDVSISWAPILDESENRAGYSVTMRDIRERKAAEKRVSEFYSVVSHELRTPLTSIRGALGLLEGRIVEISSAEAMELVEVARSSSDRLIRLINDMLDLKKIESGKMETFKLVCERVLFDGPSDLRLTVESDNYHDTILIYEAKLKFSFDPPFTGELHENIKAGLVSLSKKNKGLSTKLY